MPRKPRFYLPGIPVHIVQRGNDRRRVFFTENDYSAYLDWLEEGADNNGCAIHAFVLMTNHVHLLATPDTKTSIGRMIQHVGRKYVTYVNGEYRRSGTLWEGRHKGSLINSSEYALACHRYIEMNPVRAGMVNTPAEYRWSSFRENAFGRGPRWLRPMPEYLQLGESPGQRQFAYRELFRSSLAPEQVHAIRVCNRTGTPLGNRRFREDVEQMLGMRLGQVRRGRPRKDRLEG